MKDLTNKHIKSLQGNSRLIVADGDEAIVFEKYKGQLSVYLCTMDGPLIRTAMGYHGLSQTAVSNFLLANSKGKKLAAGIRIGPMFRGEHIRRIVVLQNLRKPDSTPFIKVIPLTAADADWTHNQSGWIPVTNLDHRASGLIIFLRSVKEEDMIVINSAYTEKGIHFLQEDYEVYVENVQKSFAFGKLIPREL